MKYNLRSSVNDASSMEKQIIFSAIFVIIIFGSFIEKRISWLKMLKIYSRCVLEHALLIEGHSSLSVTILCLHITGLLFVFRFIT